MKRRILSLLLAFVMVLGMLPTIAFAAPAESSGVYQIGTAEDLRIQLKYQCPRLDLKANALSRRLNAQMQGLKDQYGVLLTRSRGSDGRQIRLEAVDDMYDNDDVSDIG